MGVRVIAVAHFEGGTVFVDGVETGALDALTHAVPVVVGVVRAPLAVGAVAVLVPLVDDGVLFWHVVGGGVDVGFAVVAIAVVLGVPVAVVVLIGRANGPIPGVFHGGGVKQGFYQGALVL